MRYQCPALGARSESGGEQFLTPVYVSGQQIKNFIFTFEILISVQISLDDPCHLITTPRALSSTIVYLIVFMHQQFELNVGFVKHPRDKTIRKKQSKAAESNQTTHL